MVYKMLSKSRENASLSAKLTFGLERREPVSVAHLVDLDLYKQAYAYYLTLLNFTTSAAADISFAIQPMSKALVLAGQARGGNILGLVAEQQNCSAPFSKCYIMDGFEIQS